MKRIFAALVVAGFFAAPAAPALAQSDEAEIVFWQSVRNSKSPAELEAYLKAYPDGKFAPLARIRLKRLKDDTGTTGALKARETGEAKTVADAPVHDCDRLAAHPFDPDRKADGVSVGRMEADRALRACREAVAASPGVPRFTYQLGRTLHKNRSYAEAVKQYRLAAAKGYLPAMSNLGIAYQRGLGVPKDLQEAMRWYRKAAEMGLASAQFSVGYLTGAGLGVAKDDGQAVYWYRKAAMQGHPVAMLNLGKRYQRGRGITQNLRQAAYWYEKAAAAGNLEALSGIGYFYKYGKAGKPKDVAKALSLFREAANKGNASGRYNLGIMYEDGVGVAKDRREAVRLYRLAAARDKRAAKRLERLGEPLYDLAEIQRLLTLAGFDPGAADGEMGAQTRQAIRQFQRKAGLAVDGEPSVALLERLRRPASVGSIPAQASAPSRSGNAPAGSTAAQPKDLSDLNSLD